LLADGRIGLVFRRRAVRLLFAIDLFGSPPLVTLEDGELGIGAEPGFVRTLARSLRGMTLADVTARRNDRLLRLTFAARSRFGVGDRFDLYLELVPRFGNAVLVKDETVVAASKEFALSQNAQRAVHAGARYALPPLPANPRTMAEQPKESPLEYFAALRTQRSTREGKERTVSRRQTLARRLGERERKVHNELAALDERRKNAERRDELRAEGEEIFATLHSLGARDRATAKARAAELFAEYKKLAKSVAHLESRERALRASLEAIETLRWESERAADEDLDAVEVAIAELGPKRAQGATLPLPRRKRPLLEVRTASGSRIFVGRSPVENAELTFRVARPNDLWFHAQGIPGAHVILARDDRVAAPVEDLQAAASIAVFHSKARAATTAPVDYTLRKHVRKQRAAPPGLVWYTHAKTIVAQPRSPAEIAIE
jgi:predicted ribosome quality control (RQC) complex YloA/Tae2 family protein